MYNILPKLDLLICYDYLFCIACLLLPHLKMLQLTEMSRPFSVAVFNGMLYWSDTQNMAVHGSKISGKNHKIILKRPGQPFALKVSACLSFEIKSTQTFGY